MILGSLKIVAAFTNALIRMVYGDGVYVSNDAEEKLVRNRIGGAYDFEN
jgi:glycosyltransferase